MKVALYFKLYIFKYSPYFIVDAFVYVSFNKIKYK